MGMRFGCRLFWVCCG